MTRKEAIEVLNMVEAHGLADEAKQMAIQALQATGRMFIELNGEQIVYEVICDQCKGLAYFRRVTSVLFGAKYCPCCGVKMGGE